MKIAVTGATGSIGRPLIGALRADGHEIVAITRRDGEVPGATVVVADLESSSLEPIVDGVEAIAHLAGEPVAGRRWNARHKQLVRDSRVETTARIVTAIGELAPDRRPHTLVCASGIDYYGFADAFDDEDEITEDAPAGDSFLARVCAAWEAEAIGAERHGVRVVRMRTGMVLGRGDALSKMTAPYRFFVGGRLGSGKQWLSWIHIDDAVAIYKAALVEPTWRGAFNHVAGSVRNRDFAKALGRALHRPAIVPTPAFAVRAAIGELADYVLHGRRAVPAALATIGYRFLQPDLDAALRSVV